MKKHDEARRAFLIGAAAGAGALTGAGLVPDAVAQTHEQHNDAPATTAQGHVHSGGHGAFLNDDDSATVTAFAERLMPGAPGKPGATEAGVLNYIDLALAGAYADQQDFIGADCPRSTRSAAAAPARRPTSTMRPSRTATSAVYGAAPLPSTTVAPSNKSSNAILAPPPRCQRHARDDVPDAPQAGDHQFLREG